MDVLDDPRADTHLLRKYRFNLQLWESQATAIREGRGSELTGTIRGAIEPVPTIPDLRFDCRGEEIAHLRLGNAALFHGEVAVVVLNGGLATRFGGEVKGVVEVFDGHTFLSLKLADAAEAERTFGCHIPVVLMNSFATSDATLKYLEQHGNFGRGSESLFAMDQTISIRLEEDGSPFLGADQRFRYYAPGHGEFFEVLRESGLQKRLAAAGVRWLLFSNVDNLGATIEPRLLGHHISSGADLTVEVTPKRQDSAGQWDVGGAPVRIDGRPQIVEGFRFPPGFDQSVLSDIQTNNMLFSLPALAEPVPIPPYLVRKRVDGRNSLTFEAVTCEASGVLLPEGTPRLPLSVVRVPRDDLHGRFFPVKSRQDLESIRPALAERLQRGWERRHSEARM